MSQPLLILSPFVWGIPENVGVMHHFCPLPAPQEARGEAATDFAPLCLGVFENVGVTLLFRPLLGSREGRGQASTATSPLHSRGSPNKGEQNQSLLPHPCLLKGPKEGGNATKEGPREARGDGWIDG